MIIENFYFYIEKRNHCESVTCITMKYFLFCSLVEKILTSNKFDFILATLFTDLFRRSYDSTKSSNVFKLSKLGYPSRIISDALDCGCSERPVASDGVTVVGGTDGTCQVKNKTSSMIQVYFCKYHNHVDWKVKFLVTLSTLGLVERVIVLLL